MYETPTNHLSEKHIHLNIDVLLSIQENLKHSHYREKVIYLLIILTFYNARNAYIILLNGKKIVIFVEVLNMVIPN